jgi:hypothetical protein
MSENILDMDLATVDTSRQLLAKGLYDLRVTKAEIEPSSGTPPIDVLKLELASTAPASSDKGETLDPGVPVYHTCSLAPSGKATVKMVVQNVASIVQAAGLTGVTVAGARLWFKQLEGRNLRCRVDLRPEQTKDGRTFQPRNEIKEFIALNK